MTEGRRSGLAKAGPAFQLTNPPLSQSSESAQLVSETIDLTPWIPPNCPKHLVKDPTTIWKLRVWANKMRAYFGEPVYLVGGALQDDCEDPRDWDLRVIIPDFIFKARYGRVEDWAVERDNGTYTRTSWRWVAEMRKYVRNGIVHTKLPIDFQVYPESWNEGMFKDKPRLQLDTYGVDLSASKTPSA